MDIYCGTRLLGLRTMTDFSESGWFLYDATNSVVSIGSFSLVESVVPGGSILAAVSTGLGVAGLGQISKMYLFE